jgi:uncharacterized membrane protein YeiB
LSVASILAVGIAALVVLALARSNAPILLVALAIPLTLVVAFVVRRALQRLSARSRRLTPQAIASYRDLAQKESDSPEELSHSIVERAAEIQRTLAETSSEIRVEMCILGYRACANDMITLTHRINEELPRAGLIRRVKLRRVRKKATDALAGAREALPPGALRATRQEQQ